MTDARKLHPKPGQKLGKRVVRPKKTPKGTRSLPKPSKRIDPISPIVRRRRARKASQSHRDFNPLADWEKALLGIDD